MGLVQATVATVLGPLVAELAASRQQNKRQTEQLVSKAETIGRLPAERDAVRAQHAAILAAQSEPAPAELAAPSWRRWWPLVLGLVAVVVAAGLLTWPF